MNLFDYISNLKQEERIKFITQLLQSDDETLDSIQEIVNYIKNNRNAVQSLKNILSVTDENLDTLQEVVDFIKNNRTDIQSLQNIVQTNDVNLDTLQEIVDFIKQNREDLENINLDWSIITNKPSEFNPLINPEVLKRYEENMIETSIEYDNNGKVTKVTYNGGVYDTYEYDEDGKLIRRKMYKTDGDVLLLDVSINYDENGNYTGQTINS